MGKYVLKRLGLAFLTIFIILSLSYILIKLLPFERPIGGDQVRVAFFDKQYNLGYVYRFGMERPEYGELLYKSPSDHGRSNYYYQVPVMKQYFNWLRNIVTRWDWGYSKNYQPNVAASTIIMKITMKTRFRLSSMTFIRPFESISETELT